MASRSIDALEPSVRARAVAFLGACRARGLDDVLIYCTLRTLDEQAALFASGRTRPGPILTNARPGESMHNPDVNGEARAFDAVPSMGGKLLWSDVDSINLMGAAGEAAGLVWAGRWNGKIREKLHFQGAKHG